MSHLTSERLYNLLPAIYRQRDVAEGEPLRALLAIIEEEVDLLTEEMAGLYDNWFIETCEEWVVPYIGDLLGVRGLSGETNHLFSQRAHIANAIGYRRRKGVPAILERVAQDITDWRARVVEYFELLGSTQHFDNVRLREGRTFNLRDKLAVARMNSPFERAASLVDVRRIASKRGKQNIPNVGLFLWRLQSYPITHATPYQVQSGCYTFHPFGVKMPLFNRPQPKTELTQRTEELHVPYRLTRQAFAADLKAYQSQYQNTPATQQPANSQFYGPERSFLIMQDNKPLSPMRLLSRDLSSWAVPRSDKDKDKDKVAVDVELGRFAFASKKTPQSVLVSYNYAFSADIGGGPYDRRQSLAVADASTLHLQISQEALGEGEHNFSSFESALTSWAADYKAVIIEITDNRTYDLSNESLDLSMIDQLVIQAADGMRPCLKGPITVRGNGPECKLTLNGLLIEGGINLDGSFDLNIEHSTLTSHPIQLVSNPAGAHHNLTVTINNSLLGPLYLPPEMMGLTIQDSIIDGKGKSAIAADEDNNGYGPSTTLERVTLFGAIKVKTLTASEVIFTEQVEVQERQVGNVRFSYLPPDSQTPQRYRSQPDFAIASKIEEANGDESEISEIQANIHLQLQPRFTSTEYGQAGYAQLSRQCAPEIASGAENESEMGAFQHLLQPQRQANLKASLNEYLRTGLEAGIFYVT